MKKDVKSIQRTLNLVIVALIFLLFSFAGYYYYTTQNQNEEMGTKVHFSSKESIFPPLDTEFTFKTIDNKIFKVKASNKRMVVEGLENKTVFLKIFGWNCQYCKKEIPQLINLKSDLGDSFEVISIEAEEHSDKESLKYIKEYGVNYHIVNGTTHQKFYNYLRVHYGWNDIIPLTIVLGKGGNILAYEVGVKSYNLSELMKATLSMDKLQ